LVGLPFDFIRDITRRQQSWPERIAHNLDKLHILRASQSLVFELRYILCDPDVR
jgi:hypothetical protein